MEPCRLLEWDSAFFGRRIARIEGGRFGAEELAVAVAWCGFHDIECAYLLADSADPRTIAAVEAASFGLKDVRVTYEWEPNATVCARAEYSIRPAQPTDVPALESMAAINHHDSRFYADGRFVRAQVDELYRTWIRKACNGDADIVLVPQQADGTAVGYLSCHLHPDSRGSIGLVGLHESVRGRGVGPALLRTAMSWFADRSVTSVSVVTQGRNLPAQRLYQREGFVCRSFELWYHRWFA